MKHKVIAAACIGAMVLGLCGCHSTAKKQEEKPVEELVVQDTHSNDGINKVGISMPSETLERWNSDGRFLQQEFEAKGYTVIREQAKDLIDDQIRDIRGMIDQNVDLLIIGPVDGGSLSAVLKEAAQAGIPAIAYDRLLRQSPYVSYYVSFDNYKVGQLKGEYVKNTLDLDHAGHRRFNIEITAGDPVDNNARFFYNGMHDVIAPYVAKGILNIVSGQEDFYTTATSSWSTDLAEERFSGILNSYYASGKRLDAAICSNDSTALGVTRAVMDNYSGSNRVIITGQDGDYENLKNLMSGKQSMTVFKALSNEAVVTVALGDAIVSGKEPKEELIEESNFGFPVKFDTKSYDNGAIIVPSYLLEPVAITVDNVQSELVDTGYYHYDEEGNLKAN